MRNLVLLAVLLLSAFFSFGQKNDSEVKYLHIKFREIPSAEIRVTWERQGITLLEYLPGKMFTAKVVPSAQKILGLSSIVEKSYEITAEQKLHPNLAGQGIFPGWAFDEDGNVRVNLVLYDVSDQQYAFDQIEALGYAFWEGNNNDRIVSVRLPEQDLLKVAALDYVRFIEAASPDPEPENYTGRTYTRGNVIASDHPMGRHYNGQGIVIGH
ncbi:MAG: hypothetical protein R3B47_21635, partial [Bacteroidia bacterium]